LHAGKNEKTYFAAFALTFALFAWTFQAKAVRYYLILKAFLISST
jgi:hypothetical protein